MNINEFVGDKGDQRGQHVFTELACPSSLLGHGTSGDISGQVTCTSHLDANEWDKWGTPSEAYLWLVPSVPQRPLEQSEEASYLSSSHIFALNTWHLGVPRPGMRGF